MITILHDSHLADGHTVETASAEGIFVTARSRAACRLAALLMKQGYGRHLPVRIVRADPWLFGPPHEIRGVRLDTAATLDFLGGEDQTGPVAPELLRRR